MTTHTDEPKIARSHTVSGWALGEWADHILEQAGLGVTIVDLDGSVLFYNKWADARLDRKPEYLGQDVRDRHHRAVTNPRWNAMLQLFIDGRDEPVRYVARPYGKMTILVTVSPIRVAGELVGLSQIVQIRDEVEELFKRFDTSGRESFEREMLPNGFEEK
jgi:sensor histidine kinase regulating citrate/malate metabolism